MIDAIKQRDTWRSLATSTINMSLRWSEEGSWAIGSNSRHHCDFSFRLKVHRRLKWSTHQHRTWCLSQHSIHIRSKKRLHSKPCTLGTNAYQVNFISTRIAEYLPIGLTLCN